MKKRIKFLAVLFASVLLLTGCGSSELKKVYKSMQIGEGKINGYHVNVRIFGLYNDEKVSQSITIQNYMNKTIKVLDSTNNKTYVKKAGKNYVLTNETNEDEYGYRVDGSERYHEDYSEELDGEETETTQKYEEMTEDIPFVDTDLFLISLKKAKDIEDPEEETIANIKYTKYTYKVSKAIVKDMLAGTELKDLELTDDVDASVWIDENGYVYKIVYNLASGFDSKFDLELNAYFSSVNEVSEISIPGLE